MKVFDFNKKSPDADGYVPLGRNFINHNKHADPNRVLAESKRLVAATRKAVDLKGKLILDIGSGAEGSPDEPENIVPWRKIPYIGRYLHGVFADKRFEPWYCRIAYFGQANVYGVDIGESGHESHTHIQCDLLGNEALLDALKDKRGAFDIINNYKFTVQDDSRHRPTGHSPHLVTQMGLDISGGKGPDGFLVNLDYRVLSRMNEQITEQVLVLLKQGGTYTHNEFVYNKIKTRLEKIGEIEGLGS